MSTPTSGISEATIAAVVAAGALTEAEARQWQADVGQLEAVTARVAAIAPTGERLAATRPASRQSPDYARWEARRLGFNAERARLEAEGRTLQARVLAAARRVARASEGVTST